MKTCATSNTRQLSNGPLCCSRHSRSVNVLQSIWIIQNSWKRKREKLKIKFSLILNQLLEIISESRILLNQNSCWEISRNITCINYKTSWWTVLSPPGASDICTVPPSEKYMTFCSRTVEYQTGSRNMRTCDLLNIKLYTEKLQHDLNSMAHQPYNTCFQLNLNYTHPLF